MSKLQLDHLSSGPALPDVLGSDVLVGYGIAEDLAWAIVSTVEEGCIRTRKCHFTFNALPYCRYPIGDGMRLQRFIDNGKELQKLEMSN